MKKIGCFAFVCFCCSITNDTYLVLVLLPLILCERINSWLHNHATSVDVVSVQQHRDAYVLDHHRIAATADIAEHRLFCSSFVAKFTVIIIIIIIIIIIVVVVVIIIIIITPNTSDSWGRSQHCGRCQRGHAVYWYGCRRQLSDYW